jgi:predicted Rossmann-fold nucleotide-binding protein
VYNHQTAVAILGSKGSPSDEMLANAKNLSRLLAQAGYVTITSEKNPCAPAIHDAIRAANGTLVVTSASNESSFSGAKIIESPSILGRMEAILRTSDAIVLLDGGLSSLAILFQVWSYASSPNLPFRPLVLLGSSWPQAIEALRSAGWLTKNQAAMVTTVNTPEEAVESLRYYAGAKHAD